MSSHTPPSSIVSEAPPVHMWYIHLALRLQTFAALRIKVDALLENSSPLHCIHDFLILHFFRQKLLKPLSERAPVAEHADGYASLLGQVPSAFRKSFCQALFGLLLRKDVIEWPGAVPVLCFHEVSRLREEDEGGYIVREPGYGSESDGGMFPTTASSPWIDGEEPFFPMSPLPDSYPATSRDFSALPSGVEQPQVEDGGQPIQIMCAPGHGTQFGPCTAPGNPPPGFHSHPFMMINHQVDRPFGAQSVPETPWNDGQWAHLRRLPVD